MSFEMEWWSYYIFVQEAQEPKKRMLEILILYLILFAKPVLLQWNQQKRINEAVNRLEHANILRFNSPDSSFVHGVI